MASVLTVLGAQTNDSFTDFGANTDYTSRYDPFDDYVAPLTGAIGDTNSRPILFRYLQIYNTTTSVGALDLQISTGSDGTGTPGAQSASIAGSDNDPDWNVNETAAFGPLQLAAFSVNSAGTNQVFYYGFQKNDASRVRFNTSASVDTTVNPNNIWRDGTVDTAFSGRVIAGRIGWYHVPNAPTGLTSVATTSSTVLLSWSHPADDGISTSLPGGGIYGYRIVYKLSSATDTVANWSLFGSSTIGSPSDTDYLLSQYEPYDLANVPSSATVTGLTSNTNYDFKVAGLNLVTDRHNGAAVSIFRDSSGAIFNNGGTRNYGNYVTNGVQAHVGTNASITSIRTKLATPTVSGNYTATANVNQAYSSSVTFAQDIGGNATTTYWTSITSASLPSNGLSLSVSGTNATASRTATISGTPTAPGTYSITVTATNADGSTVSKSVTLVVSALGPLISPSADAAPSVRATTKVWNGSTFVDGRFMVYDGTSPYNVSGWKYLK